MTICTSRLIEGINRIATGVQSETENKDHQARLQAAMSMLNLLMLREQREYTTALVNALERGRKLVESGAALLPEDQGRPPTPNHAGTARRQGTLAEQLLNECEDLAGTLARLVNEVDRGKAKQGAEWVAHVLAWESELRNFDRRTAVSDTIEAKNAEITPVAFEAYLKTRFPGRRDAKVSNFTVLVGGMSRRTILFDMEDSVQGKQQLVIRAEQPVNIMTLEDMDITTEFGIISIAHQSGVPAPEPLWMEPDASKLGMRFIVVRRLPGTSFGGPYSISKTLSEPLLKNLVAGLHQIHNVDLDRFPKEIASTHLSKWVGLKSITEATKKYVQVWLNFWRKLDGASPILEHGFNWLFANVPDVPGRPSLLHSDYGLGNLLLEDDKVTAVLDWEATHLGDPAEELSWLMYNLRTQVPREKILQLYREAGGSLPSEYRLRYADVVHVVKTLICGFAGYTAYAKHKNANSNFYLVGDWCLAPFTDQLYGAIEQAEAVKGSD